MADLQSPSGTRSLDYSDTYYTGVHLGGDGAYGWENEEWRTFFRAVADRVIGIARPTSFLDVGCAKGLLVQALREKGVDASGFDISEHAIESSDSAVRDHVRVGSATDPIEGRYSLVGCIEVLEHMAPLAAQQAIDRMTEVTDRVLFSSSPNDHAEPTHINTKPTAAWAAAFAERGFFRRTDVDLSFLSPWAVLFERAELTVHELTLRYETQYAELNAELVEKRAALLDSHRQLSQAALVSSWEAEVLEARHQLLTTRDHIVGTEAEVARLRKINRSQRNDLVKVRKQLGNVRGRLKQVRARADRLQQRTSELEANLNRPSFARRVARKVVGGAR